MRDALPGSTRHGGSRTAPGTRRAPAGALLALAALSVAVPGCRRGSESKAGTASPRANEPSEERLFTMADLAAATRFDARLQRVVALAGEYKAALTFDRGPRLTEHTDQIAKGLAEAVREAERALQDVRDPRDRAVAQPLLAGARRWPALLRDARAELLESPHPATRAANALAATDDEVARALETYRAFRATWRMTDSPNEPEEVLEFLRSRRALEEEEADLGRRLSGAAGAGMGDSAEARVRVDTIVASALRSTARVDAPRQASAKRFVESEAQALAALAGMAVPGAIDEQRERDALAYQIAKTGALDALAEYVALTAKGSSAPR